MNLKASNTTELSDKTKCLTEILEVIDEYDLSLQTMLKEVFNSGLPNITPRIASFYDDGGPRELIETWEKSTTSSQKASLIEACTHLSVKTAQLEIETLASSQELRFPAKTVTQEQIEGFSFKTITEKVAKEAPILDLVVKSLSGINKSPSIDAETITAVISSMLLYLQSSDSNYLQTIMSLFFFSTGTSPKAIDLLSSTGLSVPYSTILENIKSMSDSALTRAKEMAKGMPWFLIYDRIPSVSRKSGQQETSHGVLEVGTTASIVISQENISKDDILDWNPYNKIQPADLIPTSEINNHFRKMYHYLVSVVLKKHTDVFNDIPSPTPIKKLIPAKRTVIIPFKASDIDTSTLPETKKFIDNIMLDKLDLGEDWFKGNRFIICTGDISTLPKLRRLRAASQNGSSEYKQLKWMAPVMQLFSLQTACSKMILRTHYGNTTLPGTIAFNLSALNQEVVSLDKLHFGAAHDIIFTTFEALVLRASEIVENSETSTVETQEAGSNVKTNRLSLLVEKIIAKYCDNLTQKSIMSTNSSLFLRDAAVYIELTDAIKHGDIGRIDEILKLLTVMFQTQDKDPFADELIRLQCYLRYSWNPNMKEAVMSSWLINPSGEEDGWIPSELYQKLIAQRAKAIYSAHSKELKEDLVSANARIFGQIESKLKRSFNTKESSSASTTMTDDVKTLLNVFRVHKVFED